MRFEFDPVTRNFRYRDNPYVKEIRRIYDEIKRETLDNYGVDKLREIISTFVSNTSSDKNKDEYTSNTLSFLSGLNAVEEKLSQEGRLSREKTTLKQLMDLVEEH